MKTQLMITVCLALATMACTNTKKSGTNTQKDSVKLETATITAQPTATATVVVTPLNGYFLKNTYTFTGEMDCLLFADQAAFDAVLGVAKTMDNKIDTPAFEQQIVGVIAQKPVRVKTDMKVSKAELIDGTTVNVYVETTKGETLTYTMTPTLVFQFPKTAGVNLVNFFVNGEKVTSVPVK